MTNVPLGTDGSRRPKTSLVLFVIFVLGALACGGGGTLDAGTLEKEIETIESIAAEGALLAADAASGRTTAAFARVHAEELAKTASEEPE